MVNVREECLIVDSARLFIMLFIFIFLGSGERGVAAVKSEDSQNATPPGSSWE